MIALLVVLAIIGVDSAIFGYYAKQAKTLHSEMLGLLERERAATTAERLRLVSALLLAKDGNNPAAASILRPKPETEPKPPKPVAEGL